MNKSLKQDIINKKAVIKNGINNALKMVLNITIYVEKRTLLQVRKQNRPSAKVSKKREKILLFTQQEHLGYSIEQEKSSFKDFCRYPNIKQQKEQRTHFPNQ